MDIILITGLWFPVSVWDDTAAELASRGHRPVPVPLPGADDDSTTASLDDQIDAVLAAVDAADRPLVVGHSAASTLAWIAADRRPESVAGAAMVGGFPAVSGSSYASFFEIEDGVMPFPGWEPFAGPDADDLDEPTRERLAGVAVPVRGPVADGRVVYTDDRRFTVPLTVVCPEFAPEDVRSWMEAGDLPELVDAEHLELVDIDSGHWPMATRPAELAKILSDIAHSVLARSRADR